MSGNEPNRPGPGPGPLPSRPSLLSTPHGRECSSVGEQSIRLLSALRPDEAPPRAARVLGTKGQIALVTVALAGVAAVFLAAHSERFDSPDVAMMSPQAATVSDASPATRAALAVAASQTDSSPMGRAVGHPSDEGTDRAARVEPSSEGAADLPRMAVESGAAGSTQVAASAPARPSAAAPAVRRVKTRAAAPKAPVTAGTHGGADARAEPAAQDPDAELVAAIMARMEPADSDRPASSERAGTIASLVRDCNAMGDSQSALTCRRRICAGYWGKAQACPRSMAPTPPSR